MKLDDTELGLVRMLIRMNKTPLGKNTVRMVDKLDRRIRLHEAGIEE